MESNKTTRRTVLTATSSAILAGFGVYQITSPSQANELELDFQIQPKTHETTNPKAIETVELVVDVDLSWTSDVSPTGYEIRVDIGPTENEIDLLDFQVYNGGLESTGSDTVQLSGLISETEHFTVDDFQMDSQHNLYAELTCTLKHDDTEITQETLSEETTLEIIENEQTGDIEVTATSELIISES